MTGKLPSLPLDIFSQHGKDTIKMDTKPFGDAPASPAANPPPIPTHERPLPVSPPLDQLNRSDNPEPAPPIPGKAADNKSPAQAPPRRRLPR